MSEMFTKTENRVRFNQLTVDESILTRLKRVVLEYRQVGVLRSHGLSNRRKILLAGPPGTGKTMTAAALAKELSLPLFTANAGGIITKFLGETSSNLSDAFDYIRANKGVYLFDEFDTFASARGNENDVGEMRRTVNAFLQFIETDESQSIIIAATNAFSLIDTAFHRRFDDVIFYEMPDETQCIEVIRNNLGLFGKNVDSGFLGKKAFGMGLSHAIISSACVDSLKDYLLSQRTNVPFLTNEIVISNFKEKSSKNGLDN